MYVPEMSNVVNNILTLAVIVGFIFLMYSKIKKESMKETFNKINNLFGGKKDE